MDGVITNNPALDMLVVKDGDTLDLGGRELSFINAPFLHWPDGMFTWSPQDKTLFSCDFLGCHFCEPYTFDYNIVYNREYELALRVYFDAIFAPFKPYVVSGLEKIRDLDLETVCTSHGPVLTKNCRLSYALEKYIEWSAPLPAGPKLIPVFYCSAYGNTGKIAEAVRSGVLDALPEANCEIFDLNYQDMGEMQALLARSSAFAVGSPTINADAVAPIWHLLSHVDAINNRKRPALVFGSYGWSGEAVPNLTARLAGLKSAVFGEGFKVNFVPSSDDLEKARELGSAFAASLRAESK
ncbi:Flavo-diiron protein FprA2 [bioreactor metagenome]|uniref:Flavo-diiron protein FprA2 n=1 Tax=bioreactor metagenome TaxID=1076179 RepID=A0A644ZMR1_9ZZZZ